MFEVEARATLSEEGDAAAAKTTLEVGGPTLFSFYFIGASETFYSTTAPKKGMPCFFLLGEAGCCLV